MIRKLLLPPPDEIEVVLITPTHVTGVLLAGGQSRRMFAGSAQSGDKGLLDLGAKPMIGHVMARLGPQVGRMVLNANGDPARFASLGLPIAPDTVAGFVGPLAGVLAGMRWSRAHASDATHIATVSTDAPFIPADLVARLAAALDGSPPPDGGAAASPRGGGVRAGPAAGEVSASRPLPHPEAGGPRIALARSAGELHPVIGLWPVALADDLEAALNAGVRKVLAWTDRHGAVAVDFPLQRIGTREVDPFFNANTPDELAEARAILES